VDDFQVLEDGEYRPMRKRVGFDGGEADVEEREGGK